DMKFGSLDLRLPDKASASIDDVEVYVGSASDRRKDAPAEGRPHVVLTGRVTCGSVVIRGPPRGVPPPPSLMAPPLLTPRCGVHRRRAGGRSAAAEPDCPPPPHATLRRASSAGGRAFR